MSVHRHLNSSPDTANLQTKSIKLTSFSLICSSVFASALSPFHYSTTPLLLPFLLSFFPFFRLCTYSSSYAQTSNNKLTEYTLNRDNYSRSSLPFLLTCQPWQPCTCTSNKTQHTQVGTYTIFEQSSSLSRA